jgi:hypothetical protein
MFFLPVAPTWVNFLIGKLLASHEEAPMFNQPDTFTPTYGPLVPTCRAFGIRRSNAFAMARAGLLATFTLNRKRYVYLDSLLALPSRRHEWAAISKVAQP